MTQTLIGPNVPPWVKNAAASLPKRILWVDGNGRFGYCGYWGATSLNELPASIRPVDEIPGFVMPPKEKLDIALKANEEDGWPLERLMALARGEIEVDSLALKLWKELKLRG